ncbi:tetratricopeptide repeat protein [Deinococcus sp. JMULE3]|uniref:tetratricopeptide repeat protein n=1 Tax=Deinococcus sp. JMULE3 TaxID=2518341 RepID=UPI001574F303|nr:tetratricopeptide repeat protein [Deinococcus sp. JMULE3]
MPEREFYTVLETLLTGKTWSAARPYFLVAARDLHRRADGRRLRTLLDRVPADVLDDPAWQEVQVWVAYRSGDRELLQRVTSAYPGQFPGFEAHLGAWHDPWPQVLERAERALAGPVGAFEAVVAARFRAVALAQLRAPDWAAAFQQALQRPQSDRDRGLLHLEFGHQLVSAGLEAEARDAWAQAATHLKGDVWALTQAYSNLGIACLRLDDLPAAERALGRAVQVANHPDARGQLSIAWRGLGGLYLWSGQLARAAHAYRLAEEKADDVPLTVMARRGLSRVLRAQGHLDEALEVLRSALHHASVQGGERHAAFTDLAAVQVLIGDHSGARDSLTRAQPSDVAEGWRAQIVQAELARRENQPDWAAHLTGVPATHHLVREEARVYPDTLAALGLSGTVPVWRIDVHLDGPVRVQTPTGELPLKPGEASLLAYLLMNRRSVAVERVLEALDLGSGDVRTRKRQLNRTVKHLREALGWPDAVRHTRDLVILSDVPEWHLHVPENPARLDHFCEGILDPWVTDHRSDTMMRIYPA